MITPEQRKARSLAILKTHNIPFLDDLPAISPAQDVRVRSAEDIARRAIACLIAIQAACDRHNDNYTVENAQHCMALLEKYRIGRELTPKEVTILNNQGSAQDVINMVWKYEAYWTLLWALGIVETLDYPDHIIDCDFAIQAVAAHDNFAGFMASTRLRSIDDILDEADLIYRYDWACVDARIHHRDMPGGLDSSVVLERHRGLNWLIDIDGDDDWDTVSVNT